MARNLTPTHTSHDHGGSVTTAATTTATTEAEKPKRVRKKIGAGHAVDKIVALRAAGDAEYEAIVRKTRLKFLARQSERERDIMDRCTDPEAARRMLKAREGE